jgi:hypothetical protein
LLSKGCCRPTDQSLCNYVGKKMEGKGRGGGKEAFFTFSIFFFIFTIFIYKVQYVPHLLTGQLRPKNLGQGRARREGAFQSKLSQRQIGLEWKEICTNRPGPGPLKEGSKAPKPETSRRPMAVGEVKVGILPKKNSTYLEIGGNRFR